MSNTEPRYISRFYSELARRGVRRQSWRYPRSGANGEVQAHRLTPAAGSRGLVLFAHATGNDAFFAQLGLFLALLEHGYAVFTFDLDGHGRSSTTKLGVATAPAAVVDAARAATDGAHGPCHVMGQSLGGSLLLHAVASGALAARSLILLSAPTRLALTLGALPREAASMMRAAFRAQTDHYGLFGMLPAFGPVNRGRYPMRLAPGPAQPLPGYIGVVSALVNGLALEAATTQTPTLLIYGADDRIVPLAQGQALAARLAHARLVTVPGGTHMTTPFEPGVAAAVTTFLAEVDG